MRLKLRRFFRSLTFLFALLWVPREYSLLDSKIKYFFKFKNEMIHFSELKMSVWDRRKIWKYSIQNFGFYFRKFGTFGEIPIWLLTLRDSCWMNLTSSKRMLDLSTCVTLTIKTFWSKNFPNPLTTSWLESVISHLMKFGRKEIWWPMLFLSNSVNFKFKKWGIISVKNCERLLL